MFLYYNNNIRKKECILSYEIIYLSDKNKEVNILKNKRILKSLVSTATAVMLFAPAVMPYENTTPEQTSASVIRFIDAEAASYSTGTYQVNTSAGCNVRKGAGTGYAKLGAATNGTQFKVTKISGNWGYGTIKCTNGTKTGWICLTYCKAVSSYSTPLSSGTSYYISPACATGNNLDVSGGGKNNSTNIISYKKNNGKNQQFKAVLKSNGYYAFYDNNSGKVIDVNGGKVANGTNVQIYQWNGTDSQLWRLIDAGNGYYYVQSKLNSSYYLDINGCVNTNGANVQLYKGNNSNAQRFKFTKVNNPEPNNSKTKLSYALYQNNSARLTCGFDGYTTTSGRHEGIDISLSNGSNVYSLTDGVVLRVAKGYQGSNGLSTIAIYYATQNKTVIYLHSNPCVSANQKISKGQKIATQDWRGCSSAGGGHTHVEVRNGKQSYAAKSVKDYTLENSNPTSFWNSLGYSIG